MLEEKLIDRTSKKKSPKKAYIILFLVSLLSIMLISGLVAIKVYCYFTNPAGGNTSVFGGSDSSDAVSADEDNKFSNTMTNILLLGVDEREHDNGRMDTIMVASVNDRDKKISLISVPRDTRVRIPGMDKYDKINAAYAYGGVDLAINAVEDLLGIKINKYVKTNFNGFADAIDTLGGIEVNVQKRMRYIDRSGGLYINLRPGRQFLKGKDALGYVRFRHDALGDLGRIKRQQEFINAVSEKAFEPENFVKLPKIISQLRSSIDTNLSTLELLSLVKLYRDIHKNSTIVPVTIPGRPVYIGGISYLEPDSSEVRLAVSQALAGKSVEENKEIRVEILNGSGIAGLANSVAEKVKREGYKVVNIGNADNFNYELTRVVDRSGKKKAVDEITRIVDGLETKVPKDKENNQYNADITIIIGKDYTG